MYIKCYILQNILIIFFINIFCLNYAFANDDNLYDIDQIEIIIKKAENGDVNSQLNLGEIYGSHKNVEYDPQKAFYWYLKAAEQGNYKAQFKIGNSYKYGFGVDKDVHKAFDWYYKAYKNGSAGGALAIAQDYGFDKHTALDILLTAAEYDDQSFKSSAIENAIAKMYDDGDGIEQNYENAYKWYLKASDHGDTTATTRIGQMYRDGIYLPQDNQKAIEWFFKSIKQGSVNYPIQIVELYNTDISQETRLEIYNFFLESIKNAKYEFTVRDYRKALKEIGLEIKAISDLPTSDLSPDGIIADIFDNDSIYTQLQKDDELEKLKDNIVEWTLPVSQISRLDYDKYVIESKDNKGMVSCIIYITPRNDVDRHYIHNLKINQKVKIKGNLTGTIDRGALVINPAILII